MLCLWLPPMETPKPRLVCTDGFYIRQLGEQMAMAERRQGRPAMAPLRVAQGHAVAALLQRFSDLICSVHCDKVINISPALPNFTRSLMSNVQIIAYFG